MSKREQGRTKTNRAVTAQMGALERPKAARPAGPVLTFLAGDDLTRTVKLEATKRSYLVGREEDADIQIRDETVSRAHAQFWVQIGDDGDPVVKLRDLGSTNGTLLNGQPIEEGELEPGDKIHLGDVLLRYDLLDSLDLQHHDLIAERLRAADIDEATGLMRKRFYLEELPELVKDWNEAGLNFAILVIDIDLFKQINDAIGHAAGDRAIERVGLTIRQQIRQHDVGIRYGGDEFVAVLPDIEMPEALKVAERIAGAIGSTTWEAIAPSLPITLSQGLAVSKVGESLDAVFQRADEALLRAKQMGRNRVEF